MPLCETPCCATSFSWTPSPSVFVLSKLATAGPTCPRDSESLNIHPLSSIDPPPRSFGKKGAGIVRVVGKLCEWHRIIQRPNKVYFWQLPRLGWASKCVCMFWCGDAINSRFILHCHNYTDYTIKQGSAEASCPPNAIRHQPKRPLDK